MKKVLLLSSVLFSTVVFAGGTDENPSSVSGVAVVRKGDDTFNLIYKGDKASDVKISIIDSENRVVFSEKLKSVDGFLRPYNFSSLGKGEYTIAIEDASGKVIEKVDYRLDKTAKAVNVLKFSNSENKFLLSAAGNGNEQLTINIYGDNDQLLHHEVKQTSGNFARVYNLSKVNGGFRFEIIHQNGEVKKVKY